MELCERLQVGRSTLREAIKALQVMGYVTIEPGRGAFLKRKNLESPVHNLLSWLGSHKTEVADLIDVRMQLEPFGARLAVERGTGEDIDKIVKIHAEYEQFLAAAPFDDIRGEHLGDLDAAFHAAIAQASHNLLLIDLNTVVAEAFREFRTRSFKVESHARNAIAPHRKILNALQKRDAVGVQRYMKGHLYKALEDMSLGAGH